MDLFFSTHIYLHIVLVPGVLSELVEEQLAPSSFIVPRELGGKPLELVKLVVELLSLVSEGRLSSGKSHPGGGPHQLVLVPAPGVVEAPRVGDGVGVHAAVLVGKLKE